jgi:hypothetical protein
MLERVSERSGGAAIVFEHGSRAWEIPAELVEARKVFDAAVAEVASLSRATDPDSLAKYQRARDRPLDRTAGRHAPGSAPA